MSEGAPIADWTSDFDHTDAAWARDPYRIWATLRGSCPVAHSGRFGGAWLPTLYEDIVQISYDTDRFTSRSVLVTDDRPPRELAPVGIAPPISSDPPFHHAARRLLLPAFAPTAIERYEAPTRERCEELVAALAGRDVVDAAAEYAQHVPVFVIADMLGFPREDADLFRSFVVHVLEEVALPLEDRLASLTELIDYIQRQIDDHLASPQEDLTSFLLDAQIDGQPLDSEHAGRTIVLLLLAGLDTTWSAIGASIWHLASHTDDLRRLVSEPELLPTAIEEFLRAYAPVTMARLVRDDVEWNGHSLKADEWMLLPFPAANRDPAAFDEPDRVLLDRDVNRHLAFGLGIHRCLGSHLARLELRVALEVWLAAFPDFELADPARVTWSGGQVRGPRALPVRIARR